VNAHQRLERQLRASIARVGGRRHAFLPRLHLWSRGLTVLVGVGATSAVAAAAVTLVVSRPRDPGPVPRNVDDQAVASAWNMAWAKDPTCSPGSRFDRSGPRLSDATPSRAMLAALPALRRPRTGALRLPSGLYVHGHLRLLMFQAGELYARYARLARTVDGIAFYLVPAARLGSPPLSPAAADRCYRLTVAALQSELPRVPAAERAPTRRYGDAEFAVGRYNLETSKVTEGVFLLAVLPNGGGFGGGGQSPSTIRQTGMLGGGSVGSGPALMDGIVPGGVATVTLRFSAGHRGSRHVRAVNVTGDVINDVFVVPVPGLFARGGWPTSAIWRSASGGVVRVVNERPFHP
jgi:hypothetical protein